MAGLNANSVFYNVSTAVAMLAGRVRLGRVGARAGGSIRGPATLANDYRHAA
jgi:hypothetical protein